MYYYLTRACKNLFQTEKLIQVALATLLSANKLVAQPAPVAQSAIDSFKTIINGNTADAAKVHAFYWLSRAKTLSSTGESIELAGIEVHYLLKRRANWLNKILPVTSMIGIVLILVIIIAKGSDALLQVGGLIILATFIHNTFGYLLGYGSGRLFKFNERDSRTIALEVGMQNAGLASALASKMSTNPAVALAPAIFGPLMNITGSVLSSWWHNRVPKDDSPDEQRLLIKKKCWKADLT